ncbi:MAG TPA: disulfide bond formation protein B [Gammaproteobacteria bacterium]|nr:disulfide bond formation protein B [Gammaproteobacteria bacterium]
MMFLETGNSRRWLNLIAFLVCAGLLAYAYYLQLYVGLQPCPLCIFQRIGIIILGLLFLLAGIFSFRGRGARVWAVLLGLFAIAGALTSARHLWVQAHPDAVASCGPNLGYMMQNLPIFDVIKRVFTGSGDCAIVHWTFLGLSMPGWTLIWFVLLGAFGVWVNWRRLPSIAPAFGRV